MKNCKVKRFKVSVNNPDLPILETMQQFTLDVIAASGNNSMTDAQKLALNHFFYQIGAISNSGIYAKLQVLALPFIAGTKNGALVNIKENGSQPTDISSNVTFSNGGFFNSSSSTETICKYAVDIATTKLFTFLSGKESSGQLTMAVHRALRSATQVSHQFSYFSYLSSSPKVTYSQVVSISDTIEYQPNFGSINVNNGSPKVIIGTFDQITEAASVVYRASESDTQIYSYEPIVRDTNNAPYGCAVGSEVTADEQLLFTSSFKDLLNAFVTQE